jgi:hypothetical protein
MQEGAFVLIDCLGFKGIWKRTDPDLLLQKFSRLGPSIQEQLGQLEILFSFGESDRLRIHNRLLSDTVALSFQLEGREGDEYSNNDRQSLVFCACIITPLVMYWFLEGEPPLVLRGCITYGEHFIENNFIAGPAIDEAAEYMNSAEGAFVWLHPSAATLYRACRDELSSYTTLSDESIRERIEEKGEALAGNILIRHILESSGRAGVEEFFKLVTSTMVDIPFVIDPYRMPIKNGGYLECPVINPLIAAKSGEEMRTMIEKYSAYISGDKLNVWLKRQNTIEFLLEAHRRFEEFEDSMQSRGINADEVLRGIFSA